MKLLYFIIFTVFLSFNSVTTALRFAAPFYSAQILHRSHHLNDDQDIKSDGSDLKILLPTQSKPTPDPTGIKPEVVNNKNTVVVPTTQILDLINRHPVHLRSRFRFPCRHHHRVHRFPVRVGPVREIGNLEEKVEFNGFLIPMEMMRHDEHHHDHDHDHEHRHERKDDDAEEREEKVKINGVMMPMEMMHHDEHHHEKIDDDGVEIKEGVSEEEWDEMMRRHHHHHHHHHEHHHEHHDDGIINKIRKFLIHF